MKFHPKFKKGAVGATLGVVLIALLGLFDIHLGEYEAGLLVGVCNQIGVWLGAPSVE